jgi:hypothetical protein
LLQRRGVRVDGDPMEFEAGLDLDRAAEGGAQQRKGFLDQGDQVDGRGRLVLGLHKMEQTAREAVDLAGVVAHLGEFGLAGMLHGEQRLGRLQMSQELGHELVDLLRDPAGEPPCGHQPTSGSGLGRRRPGGRRTMGGSGS